MGNVYQGTKFTTDLKKIKVAEEAAAGMLIKWGEILAKKSCAPQMPGGFGGNLSCRVRGEFLITAAGCDLGKLELADIVKVISTDYKQKTVSAQGMKLPSSESLLHGAVYKVREDIKVVFHGHYPVCEQRFIDLGLPVTGQEAPYGTPELVEEVLKVMGRSNFVLLRNHGFISLGKNVEEAGTRILDICERCR